MSPTGMASSPSSTNRCVGKRATRLDDLGKIAAERLARLGEQLDLVVGAEREAAKAVPLRLELPARPLGQRLDELRLHRLDESDAAGTAALSRPDSPSLCGLRMSSTRSFAGYAARRVKRSLAPTDLLPSVANGCCGALRGRRRKPRCLACRAERRRDDALDLVAVLRNPDTASPCRRSPWTRCATSIVFRSLKPSWWPGAGQKFAVGRRVGPGRRS